MHVFTLPSVEHDIIELPQEYRAQNNPEGELRHCLCLSEAQEQKKSPERSLALKQGRKGISVQH